MAEGCLELRDPTLFGGGVWSKLTLSALIEVAGEDESAQLDAKIANEHQ